MKKLLGILALTAVATSLFAQGLVGFNNSSSVGPVKKWTSTANSTAVVVGKTVGTTINARVQLLAFYNSPDASLTPLFTADAKGFLTPNFSTLAGFLAAQPPGTAVQSSWTAYGTAAIGSLQNGVFSGGTQTIGGSAQNVDLPDGGPVRYAVLAWGGNYASYDAAYQAVFAPGSTLGNSVFFGLSQVFSTGSGNPFSTPAGTATSISTTWPGLTLAPLVVPEPGTFALAGLGLAALLVFRRRN